MGAVLVGQVVGIDDFWLSFCEDLNEIVFKIVVGRIFNLGAWQVYEKGDIEWAAREVSKWIAAFGVCEHVDNSEVRL